MFLNAIDYVGGTLALFVGFAPAFVNCDGPAYAELAALKAGRVQTGGQARM